MYIEHQQKNKIAATLDEAMFYFFHISTNIKYHQMHLSNQGLFYPYLYLI